MKKSFFIIGSLISMMLLSACPGGHHNPPVTSGGGTVDSGGGTDSGGGGGGGQQDEEYDAWANSWSKSGHLYIHYLRPEARADEYKNYALWIWQHAPQDLEGTLWAYSGKTKISDTQSLYPMSTGYMTGAEVGGDGNAIHADKYGAIIDVDLNKTGLVGGKTGTPTTFAGATNVGFLLVQQDSMTGSTHWASDGGRETYIKNFDTHFRSNGSMHIYCVSGSLSKFSFGSDAAPAPVVNPTIKDTTGKYSSKTDTIVDTFQPTPTSDDFKSVGVGYQVFVASFRDSDGDGIGDIRGVIDSLDYLDDLGVQALWLTPVQESDSYHGYDVSDYYAIDERFGTVDDYRELIYKAHEKGMKVLMDLVLNHTSKGNVWFTKSQWAETGKDENGNTINWRDVYHWKFETDKIKKYINGSYKEITVKEDAESTNPSWYRDGESHYYYYGKFGSGMPEINYECQATRNLVKNMAKYWLSFGLDGFRLDAVKHIYMKDEVADTGSDIIISDTGTKHSYDDEKGIYTDVDFDYSSDLTKNITWWKEFAGELKSIYPHCFLVGENFDGWGTRTAPYYQALDSQFDFSAYYHISQFLYANFYKYGSGGASSYAYKQASETFEPFASMNDIPLGDKGQTVPGGKRPDFIDGAFTSNHDVMRAINKVNGTFVDPDNTAPVTKITGTAEEVGRAKVHGAVTMLTPGCSWIYYGDELGMSSNTNMHISKYGNENCEDIWYRQPFLWTDTSIRPNFKSGQYKFELDSYNSTLATVDQQKSDANSMLNFYKGINEVKAAYPKGAKCEFNSSSGQNVLIMDITGQGPTYRIFINTGCNSDSYGVGGMTQGYSFFKAVGGASAGDISKPYSVLVYKK